MARTGGIHPSIRRPGDDSMMGSSGPKPDRASRPAGIVLHEVDGVRGVLLLNADHEPVLWMRGEVLQDLELRLNMKPMKAFWEEATQGGQTS